MSTRSPLPILAAALAVAFPTVFPAAGAAATPAPWRPIFPDPSHPWHPSQSARSGGDDTKPKPADPALVKPKKKQVEKLTAWPKPADKDVVLTDIERLCKSRTPEMGVQAREALEAAGASAVPFLLDRLGREREADALKRVREVLIANTNAAHTRLLAKEFENRFQPTRTFALWRAAAFPDPEIRPAAEAAWARIEKQGPKADPDERYAAALAAASVGSTAGLEAIFEASLKRWDRRGVEIRAALEGVRGAEASKFVLEKPKDADRKQKVAALRMLAGCGDKPSLGSVKPYLDDNDNQVCVAAINACRGIVEGAPPQEQLPVFEAIETAKKWKEKI